MARTPLLSVTGTVLALFVVLCCGLASAQNKGEPAPADPKRVGVIIALGFGHEEEGKPTRRMLQRVGTAVQAWNQKRAKYVMFCGGYTSGHVAEAEEMKIMAMALGIPERSILVENGSISTVQNARNTERVVKKRRFRSALLVTHRNHMNRAYRAFKEIKGLRSVHRMPADEWTGEPLKDNLDQELPPAGEISAVIVHGRSQPVDFMGDTVTLDSTQASLARTAALVYQRGMNAVPYYIWHPAHAVGHVSRAEVIGIAAIAFGLPGKVLRYAPARRFAPGKRGLFETCQDNGWTRVLAILPKEREEEADLVEQQYGENGITATVILAAPVP